MAWRGFASADRRVVAEIVRLLLPDYPRLDPPAQTHVRSDVTDFVMAQIGAMPSFLRVPYCVAVIGFDWLPLLRYGGRFRRLEEPARVRYLTWWSAAPVGVMRNFVKLIRSCAVLAYFDHPLVMERLEFMRTPAAVPKRVSGL
jgi:hypothetical protein